MTATVHISPRSEAIRPFVQRSYTLPRLFFFHTLSTYIYIYILHALFNFNDDVSLRFNRRIFHRCSCGLFHLRFFLFFFTSSPSIPFGCSVSQVQGRAHRTLCGEDKLEISCATKYRQRLDEYIFVCVCSRGDNGISGRAGSLLNIRPLGVLYTYGSLGTGYQMARGVASVTLPITNLEIAVPLSAMNWFRTRARLAADQFRFLSSFLHFFLSLLFGFSFPFSGGMASLAILSSIYLIFDSVFLKIIRRIIYIPLLTSTKWILLRGSLGNNKGKAWRSLRRPIRRIKREMWHSFGSFWKERKGWKVGTAINIVVQYNAALENSGRVKGVGRKSA